MKLTKVNSQRLREQKASLRLPMNRIVNDILEKHFTGQMKEVAAMKITEVEVLVSKKKSVNFNSCCVSYTVRATLDENDQDHLETLRILKDQLVAKVQEAINGKCNGGQQKEQISQGNHSVQEIANAQEGCHE
jgi:glutaredoxin-related protein